MTILRPRCPVTAANRSKNVCLAAEMLSIGWAIAVSLDVRLTCTSLDRSPHESKCVPAAGAPSPAGRRPALEVDDLNHFCAQGLAEKSAPHPRKTRRPVRG